jgi:hypothetical protein
MIPKKVCILGEPLVGQRTLLERATRAMYSDQYRASVGATISKKEVVCGDAQFILSLWFVLNPPRPGFLRGSAGLILMVDGTRRETLAPALENYRRAAEYLGEIPTLILFNKSDLSHEWAFAANELEGLSRRGFLVKIVSAKTGDGVESAFQELAAQFGL